MKKVMFFGALALAILLMLYPAEAFEAAFQAMCTWATSFAPSLFPFFLLIPALTCNEALAFYEKVFGRLLPSLFGIPGRGASAACVGLLAGSPAGSIAAARVISAGGFSLAQAKRLAILASGLSPMFLLSAVGVGLFKNREVGAILMRSNILSLLSCAFVLKFAFRRDENTAVPKDASHSSEGGAGILASVQQLAGVCGYMVLFATVAKLLSILCGSPSLAAQLLGVLEIAGGVNALSKLDMPYEVRVVLYSALCCFSGVCVIVQNRIKLKFVRMRTVEFAGAKFFHAVLGAFFAYLQLKLFPPSAAKAKQTADSLPPLYAAAIVTILVSACVFFDLRKHRGQAAP